MSVFVLSLSLSLSVCVCVCVCVIEGDRFETCVLNKPFVYLTTLAPSLCSQGVYKFNMIVFI